MIYHPQQQLIYGGLKEERIEDILASKGIFWRQRKVKTVSFIRCQNLRRRDGQW